MTWHFAEIAGGIALVALAAACDSPAAAEITATSRTPTPREAVDAESAPLVGLPPEGEFVPVEHARGFDFVSDARTLLRVAACGPDGTVPARFDARVVDAHCAAIVAEYEAYRARWLDVAEPFLRSIVPGGLPPVVVYPFGGGDLLTALATFPDATEFITMSLEPPGDVRTIETLPPPELATTLAPIREHVSKRLRVSFLSTKNLGIEAHSELPGELVLALVALAVQGYEPTSLRYFDVAPDGSVTFASLPTRNVELVFRARNAPRSPTKTLRHLSVNLDDAHLAKNPGLVALLESKAPFCAMTKAASHLLWMDGFSSIRQLLLDRMAWMISDSTGIPPRFARRAGFVQDAYGQYDGPDAYGPADGRDVEAFEELFRSATLPHLPFGYGYPDARSHGLVVVTHR